MRGIFLAMTGGVVLAACGGLADEKPAAPTYTWSLDVPPSTGTRSTTAGLTVFNGPQACADVEANIEDREVLQMRTYLSSSKTYALDHWRCKKGLGCAPYGFADAGSFSNSGGSGGSGGASTPQNVTTTNTQTAQVDEPDLMKNDGTRIFVLSGRTLYSVRSWPAATMASAGSLKLTGRPIEMFLDGNRIVVFSRTYERAFDSTDYCGTQYEYCGDWYSNATEVTFIDVSDLAHMAVVARHFVPGRYESARRVGSAFRMISQSRMPHVNDVKMWVSESAIDGLAKETDVHAYFEALAMTNEALIRAKPLSFWLPTNVVHSGSSTASLPLDCASVVAPQVSAQSGRVTVSTFNMTDPAATSTLTMVGDADLLYASTDALYVGSREWSWDAATSTAGTWLYKFDTSDISKVSFVAAGHVDGTPLSSYSLDEYQGALRIAVTDTVWKSGSWTSVRNNRVVVLAPRNDVLAEIGRTGNIANGESITSVRFVGERGYVVTYLRTDPLYVLDLHDAAHPTVMGELKVPGFSTYLHPLDPNHLLAVGTFVPDGAGQWSSLRRVQLSLFDVTDPLNPKQTATHTMGNSYSFSEAQWEPRAFSYLPATKLLAVPFYSYNWSSNSYAYASRLNVFSVDVNTGFAAKGSIAVDDLLSSVCAPSQYCDSYWYWSPRVRRSVIADDFVYAVTNGGIRVAQLNALNVPLATVSFAASP